ncbi:hypothetical protein DAPPUDRAFT_226030 [Daphnia pulex]|uniref:Uncharacterized protein n=1 Tax=Daphnia pulex TaxID=6669 RepID=E9GVK4_DAPPU|nr:hypothetical protein DAPPUDRAFT_226030 [Daphnia pulex]|eukprot:EFX76426.1 hypothetical protein DAPPUDRAFT_226030 [Daphnia pulex]
MTTELELAEQEADDFTAMNRQGKRRAREMKNRQDMPSFVMRMEQRSSHEFRDTTGREVHYRDLRWRMTYQTNGVHSKIRDVVYDVLIGGHNRSQYATDGRWTTNHNCVPCTVVKLEGGCVFFLSHHLSTFYDFFARPSAGLPL